MIRNTETLTKEFCKDKILLFSPTTEKETMEIQYRLFKMGFSWKNSGQDISLTPYISKCEFVLLEDGHIYTTDNEETKKKALLCTFDQFETAEVVQSAPDKVLTAKFCRSNKYLFFFPKTEEEAVEIQKRLFGMGFLWPKGGKEIHRPSDCIHNGILLDEGNLYSNVPAPCYAEGLLCAVHNLKKVSDIELMNGDQLIRTVFNEMSRQIKELKTQVRKLEKKLDHVNRIPDIFKTGPR